MNLYREIQNAFPADRDSTAIDTDTGLAYSWRDLDRASAMLANLLQHSGLQQGDRVAAQLEKSVEAMLLYLACLRAGMVFVPLNTAYQREEMAYFLQNAAPKVLVCKSENFTWLSKLAFQSGVEQVYTLEPDRTGSLLDRAVHHSDAQTPVDLAPDALAAIIYTSGTTGRSKGAMLSHANLLSNAVALNRHLHWQASDVLLHCLPMFHVHGLFIALHAALLGGSRILWHGQFQADKVIADFARASVFMGVPTYYTRMLASEKLRPEVCQTMRLFMSGSAPMLPETFHAWQARTGKPVLERYGMSETVILTAAPYAGKRVAGSVGFALSCIELRIADDANQSLSQGEIGAIQVRGSSVFSGYWQMPEKTAEEFSEDGFFKTGDVGRIDDEGYLFIVGRSKDLIISGGYNVYPVELEDAINAMPGVLESAVVGAQDADFGEVGVAIVVAKPDALLDPLQIISELKKTLANYKIPKRCYLAKELPRNTMGKVQKNILRETFK